MSIKVAIIGVGNCAKSLVEGVALYSNTSSETGLAFRNIGGYEPKNIEFVAAYDIDSRKIGKPLKEAIYAKPNCAMTICPTDGANRPFPGWIKGENVVVQAGSLLDGCAEHMRAKDPEDSERFLVSFLSEGNGYPMDHPLNFGLQLKDKGTDVALIYLPVGSKLATEFYVKAFIAAGIPFINCIPEFIVSDPEWGKKITDAGIPAIGDDMRSQVGASILSQALQEMFLQRGAEVQFHCQTNIGGNTDFMNMIDVARTKSKKISKENVIASQNALRGLETVKHTVHAGPSDYVPYMKDNKVAHIRIEARGFGGVPITLDCRLSVQDSPNSAGVVIDAIRYLQTARDKGIVGPLLGPSAATQKTPPKQMTMDEAYKECVALANWRKPLG